MTDLPARTARPSTAFLAPAGPRLPSRLRSRRQLVVPPVPVRAGSGAI